MSIFDKVSKPADRAVMATIFGDSGMGKTTLACTFPKPIVIRAEDGLQAIPLESRPDAFPLLTKSDDLWEQLTGLIREDHDYKSVVIDSATALERLFTADILASDPKKPNSLAKALGGYGAGFEALATYHARVKNAANLLIARGINVIFTAHAEVEHIELPDADGFDRYSLRLHKKSIGIYLDEPDLVGYIRLQTFTRKADEDSTAKAISTGERVLTCHAVAANRSKNRYGITEDLPVELGSNPLTAYIPSLQSS